MLRLPARVTEEARAAFEERFQGMDTDHDRCVTLQEFERQVRATATYTSIALHRPALPCQPGMACRAWPLQWAHRGSSPGMPCHAMHGPLRHWCTHSPALCSARTRLLAPCPLGVHWRGHS